MTLHIGVIAPEVLGTYGDTGNALVTAFRARARGIDTEIHMIHLDTVIPQSMDLYIMGGGEDNAQRLAAQHLRRSNDFCSAVRRGKPLLAICASLQILGNWYVDAQHQQVTGAGLLDVTTVPQGHRAIGELVTRPLLQGVDDVLTGFENHGGTTRLGDGAQPLGSVLVGTGNGDGIDSRSGSVSASQGTTQSSPQGSDDNNVLVDGALQGGIVATYMHGPLLARNPQLADYLICQATGMDTLEPLQIDMVDRLREERLRHVGLLSDIK